MRYNGFCGLTWTHSPSERLTVLENACHPLESAYLPVSGGGTREPSGVPHAFSCNPGCTSGGHYSGPLSLKPSSRASGFMTTQTKGGISSYLCSVLSLCFCPQSLSWLSIELGGTEVTRTSILGIAFSRKGCEICPEAQEMDALGDAGAFALLGPHRSSWEQASFSFVFHLNVLASWTSWLPTLREMLCQFQQMDLLRACQLVRKSDGLGRGPYSPAEMNWCSNSSPKKTPWSVLTNENDS